MLSAILSWIFGIIVFIVLFFIFILAAVAVGLAQVGFDEEEDKDD